MKLILTLIAAFLVQLSVAAADSTILFRKISYSRVFELAKKEKKAILLYFHFDGCGACVKMEKTAFINKSVASFYNSNFVCLEVNTRKGEGIETNKIYKVELHPTYLFLDENGRTLNKIVGAVSPEEFVIQGRNALDPAKTLAYLKEEYKRNRRDGEFLFNYCYRLRDANELDSTVINAYLNTQTINDLKDEKNIKFIYEFIIHKGQACITIKNKAYAFMLDHKNLFVPYFDPEQVNTRLMFAAQSDVYSAIEKSDTAAFWAAIHVLKQFDSGIEYNYKEMDGRTTMWTTTKTLVLSATLDFYEKTGDSEKYNQTLNLFIDKIWNDYDALNTFSWNCYESTDDKSKIERAIECVKRSIDINSNYANNDTYACLLYKSGRLEAALTQAEKAIDLAKQQKLDYKETADLITKIKTRQQE